jgi:hypothetical protein
MVEDANVRGLMVEDANVQAVLNAAPAGQALALQPTPLMSIENASSVIG